MRRGLVIIIAATTLVACSPKTTSNNQTQDTINNQGSVQIATTPTIAISPSLEPSQTATPSVAKGIQKIMNEAIITTSKGAIKIKLYPDSAPKTVANFSQKAKNDYYKNLTFHRVEDWVVQGGDPEGTGRGGGDMATELSKVPFKTGSVGVARGPNVEISNDSQFFICTQDCSWLTGGYTNFGEVVEGMDVVKKIAIGDKILSVKLQ